MKKVFAILLMAVAVMIVFVSCDEAKHEHSYGTEWKYDENNHWHECECEEKKDVAAHKYGEWKASKEDGKVERTCSVCDYVEKVDGILVSTAEELKTALDSLEDGWTIFLAKDLTSETGFLFNKDVTATFDLNAHTLKVTNDTDNSHRAIKITNGSLTIKNGTIDARNVDDNGNPTDYNVNSSESYTSGIYGTIRVDGGSAKAVLNNLSLYNNHCWGMSVKVCSGNTAEIKDCTFISSVGGCIEAAGGTVTITKSTFEQTGTSLFSSYVSTGIAVSYGGEVTVNNSGFDVSGSHALYVYSSGGEIIVNGGSYSSYGEYAAVVVNFDSSTYGISGESTTYKVTQTYLDEHNGKAAVITINSGKISGALKTEVSGTDLAAIVIKGGTFSTDPSAYVDTTAYKVEKDSSGNTWTVVKKATN